MAGCARHSIPLFVRAKSSVHVRVSWISSIGIPRPNGGLSFLEPLLAEVTFLRGARYSRVRTSAISHLAVFLFSSRLSRRLLPVPLRKREVFHRSMLSGEKKKKTGLRRLGATARGR